MMDPSSIHFETLSLTQIIRLQNQLSTILTQRFERYAALVFSDIVGSTAYFARFGDEAGHRLQQQHFDLLSESIAGTEGQIMDKAGDGALLTFTSVEAAVHSLLRFKKHIRHQGCHLSPEHQWTTRVGIHWGAMLTDGTIIAGDSVNLCAKVASTAQPGQIRLTKSAFNELPNSLRLACQTIGVITLPSTSHSLEVVELLWQELLLIPSIVRIEETGEQFPLPDQSVVTFGRLAEVNGTRANDVVLELPDPHLTHQISRWHLEILREGEGLMGHSLSDKLTEVNGQRVQKGQRVLVTIGTQVRLAGVITLHFLSRGITSTTTDTTLTE